MLAPSRRNFSVALLLPLLLTVQFSHAANEVAESATQRATNESAQAIPAPETVPETVPETSPADSQPQTPATSVEDADRLAWDERIDRMERAQLAGDLDAENPDKLYVKLTDLLLIRARQFELILGDAGSRDEVADPRIASLQAEFPAADPMQLRLPSSVVSVQQVHENFLALYDQRIRLLEFISPDLRMRVMGTRLYGMAELSFEARLIWLELRYQALRIPAAGQQLVRMLTGAPLPLIWFFIYLALLIFVFRWWRAWFPETIKKVQANLLSIRPRSTAILSRMRGLWYVERVRKPIEWYVFYYCLLQLIGFLQLQFVTEVSEIIIRWVLFAWFAVVLLDALVARGSGGATGDLARTRLHSLRLLAMWLLLLGLGLDLAARLAGEGALYALVWRAFQVMAFPVVFIQLGMWRNELFRRVSLEDRDFMSRAEFNNQRGLKKYTGSARLAGFLFANALRKLILRRIVDLDPVRSSMGERVSSGDETAAELLAESVRTDFLNCDISYTRYSRDARKRLIAQIDHQSGGRVVVTGERGIGKDDFLLQVCSDIEGKGLILDCEGGSARNIERQFAEALGISGPLDNSEEIASAIAAQNIQAIALRNTHMLVRPVVGGFTELQELTRLFEFVPLSVTRIMAMDRYAWEYIRCALAERAASADVIALQSWSDEQIAEMLDARCEHLGLDPDFSKVRVPSQYLEGDEERRSVRNRNGIFSMVASLSGGNPSIAARLFIDCIRRDDKGKPFATLPANADIRPVEQATHHLMLVLRVIAQAEHITRDDIVENLRYPESVVINALQFALEKRWIAEHNGQYSLTWPWFRTITRVLSRQNLLAGVRYAS